jgi:hypothetical protein
MKQIPHRRIAQLRRKPSCRSICPSSSDSSQELRPVSSSVLRPGWNDVSRTIACEALTIRRPALAPDDEAVTVVDLPPPATRNHNRHLARGPRAGRSTRSRDASPVPSAAPCGPHSRGLSIVSHRVQWVAMPADTVTVPDRVPAAPAAGGFADPSLSERERQRAIGEGRPRAGAWRRARTGAWAPSLASLPPDNRIAIATPLPS